MSFGRRSIDPPLSPPGGDARLPPHEMSFLSVVGTPQALLAKGALPSKEELVPIVRSRLPSEEVRTLTRGQLAGRILEIVREASTKNLSEIDPLGERQLVTDLIE